MMDVTRALMITCDPIVVEILDNPLLSIRAPEIIPPINGPIVPIFFSSQRLVWDNA